MVVQTCQPVDNSSEKPSEAQLDILQPGINYTIAADELHQYLRLSGGSRGQLEGDNKRKQDEISKLAILCIWGIAVKILMLLFYFLEY
jgi:hypothetical protein